MARLGQMSSCASSHRGLTGVNGLPMTMKVFLRYVWELVEVEAEFDARLVVWLRGIRQLVVVESVVDLLESHLDRECFLLDFVSPLLDQNQGSFAWPCSLVYFKHSIPQ